MLPLSSPLLCGILALVVATEAQLIHWNLTKRHGPRNAALHRRSGSLLEESVKNEQSQGGYFATVSVGTPGQEVSLQLDTGSSDLWVPSVNAAICREAKDGGCSQGSFNPDGSETFDVIGSGLFNISYQDNSTSKGDYFTDVLKIGSSSIDNFTMGLGLETTVPFGLIGVGYDSNEASNDNSDIIYPNLPVALQKKGIINSVAYSLWLNDLDASSGSILFGGVDADKFLGNLMSIPLVSEGQNGTIVSFLVSLYSLEATSPSGHDVLTSSETSVEAILDSGTTLTYLPQDMARQTWEEVGAVYDANFQSPVLPCSYRTHSGYFSFLIAGPQGPRINVSMDELVLDISGGQQQFQFSSGPYQGQEVCAFGLQNSSDTPYILGDTFLRSAYVVYDLVNNEVGIAATNFNSSSSKQMAFASNGAKIPLATQAPVSNSSRTGPSSGQNGLTASQGFREGNDGLSLHVSTLLLVGATAVAMICSSI